MTILMPIGKMDRRITIERLVQGIGEEYGEPTQTWIPWKVGIAANVFYGPGREFEAAKQINAEISVQFQIHYCVGLLDTMRILFDGMYFDIDHHAEVGRRNRWNIWAKARRE